jgi:ABC-type uncharacterized transport system ATPase subunit
VEQKNPELFKGMAQKNSICCLCVATQITHFDEPFSGFNPVDTSLSKMVTHLEIKGATIIFSTHRDVEMCDHIALQIK